jgi:hypothetical protein
MSLVDRESFFFWTKKANTDTVRGSRDKQHRLEVKEQTRFLIFG